MKNSKQKELFDRNRDLFERLGSGKEKVSFIHLEDEDVVLITVGKPMESVGISVDDNLVVHYNPKNSKIVGFTITSCKEWVKTNKVKTSTTKNYEIDPIASLSMARLAFA